MLNTVKGFIQTNQKTIIKGAIAAVGTVGGFMLINKLIKAGSTCEVESEDLEDEDSDDEDSDNEETEN